ncbi:MAG: T9SS type A sorting domain-containing protein [Bacteroidota bacterium]|nr:T9SS type A sorting domain-containing protein [Bacteroidota bacterium]
MIKIVTIFCSLTIFSFVVKSQCTMVPISLAERIDNSTVIVEAQVVEKTCFWNENQTMIYTANQLSVSQIFKGPEHIEFNDLKLITLGGTINLNSLKVHPELELEKGDIGIFLLVKKDGYWMTEGGQQGFIKIDKHTGIASDVYHIYPKFSIQKSISKIVGVEPTIINFNTKINISSKRASPTLSSFSPTTITSGTSSILTIKGSNFKTTRDTSSVQFKDADDGGKSYIKALKKDYISWSDTMISLVVRTSAGTGKIRIVVGGNGVIESTNNLTVSYAHSNVVQGDTIAYENQLIGINVAKGYTWRINKKFYDSTGAKGAFIRSLERWRCGTLMNWDTLGTLNHSAISRDKVNMCGWDTSNAMPNGTLAQCFSWYAGCFSSGTIKWFTEEMDIRFRVKPTNITNWNYSTGNATSAQFHFESVATHELGHGHQLTHVINSPVVMHFNIGNGQTKPNLVANDIDCGTYVLNKSATVICAKPKHEKLTINTCSFVQPVAFYKINNNNPCNGETITFTDSSTGNISGYNWNFGSGAVPASANTKGPHLVKYNISGTKNPSLTIITASGNTNYNQPVIVKNDSISKADFTYFYHGTNEVGFTNQSQGTGNVYKWYFGDGDSSDLINPKHQYVSANNKMVTLKANGVCSSDEKNIELRNFTNLELIDIMELIQLSPNPSNGEFNLLTPNDVYIKFEISDINGRILLQNESTSNQISHKYNFAPGVYNVKIMVQNQIKVFKWVIE